MVWEEALSGSKGFAVCGARGRSEHR